VELLLDTARCFKQITLITRKRAGLRRLFLLIFIILLFFSTSLCQAIPWSLDSAFISYFNAPLDWHKGYHNMTDVDRFIVSHDIITHNYDFLESISQTYQCRFSVVKKLFQSKIIVIKPKKGNDLFEAVEQYLFDIEKQYHLIQEGLHEGILIVERYQGLQEFLEIMSGFKAEFFRQGDYLIASTDKEYFSAYLDNIVNRNEFSEDILIYAETQEKNLTLTNAFSFLNIEIKTLEPGEPFPQILMQIIDIPLKTEMPKSLFLFTNQKAKEEFYKRFEVISSVDEWHMIFNLIDAICVYGFFYEYNDQWLIGFKAEEKLYQNDSFRNQILSWGISEKQTIKPYANEFYLSVIDSLFLISNFKPERSSEDDGESGVGQALMSLKEKVGKREVYEVGYKFNEEFGFNVYFFSSFDDKIKKEVIRIF